MCADASRDCSDIPYATIFGVESSIDGKAIEVSHNMRICEASIFAILLEPFEMV